MDGAKPQIDGRDVDLETAMRAATDLIRASKLPLYGGLGTDVDGIRAVMALADKTGGVVDHALSEGQYRNFRVLQTRGWVMTTLTETRNRADVIIVVGTDIQTAASAILRAHRQRGSLAAHRAAGEAHGGVHRQGARSVGGQGTAHRQHHHAAVRAHIAWAKSSLRFRRKCAVRLSAAKAWRAFRSLT